MSFFSIKNNKLNSLLFPTVLALLPIAAVFLEEEPIPYIIILLAILFLVEKNKKINFKLYKSYLTPYFIVILVYITYTLLAVKISPALKILERQVSILLIPLIVFASSLNKDRLRLFFKAFIIVMSMVSVFSIFLLLWFMDEHAEWIEVMNQTSQSKTYLQYKFPHLIGAHPTYWTYLLVLANLFLLCSKSLNLRLKMGWVVVLLILFNTNILYLSARTPTVINVLIHLIAITFYIKSSQISKIKTVGLIAGVILIGFVALKMPLVVAKFSDISNDERVYLWPRAIEQIKSNCFVLGEGLGQGRRILKDYIIESGDPRVTYKGFDLHNQYLVHYLDMGILGVLSLLYLIMYPLLKIKKRFDFETLPLIGFSLLFVISINTESSLYYIKGIIIFAVFSSILLKKHHILQQEEL